MGWQKGSAYHALPSLVPTGTVLRCTLGACSTLGVVNQPPDAFLVVHLANAVEQLGKTADSITYIVAATDDIITVA